MRFDDGTFAFTRKDPMYFYVLNDSEMLHFNGEDIFVGDSDIAEVLADLLGSED
jgi:hypothetical protein